MAKTKKQKVFIAYESQDEAALKHLLSQLSPLERNGKMETWHNGLVAAGSERELVILEQLKQSDLILLLVSSTFIASDFFYNTFLPQAIHCAENPKVHLIPIITKSCMWEDTLLQKFVALPPRKVPIVSNKWGTLEEPYVQIVQAIKRLIEGGKLESLEEKKEENDPGKNVENTLGNINVLGLTQNIDTSINIGGVRINVGANNSEANEELYMNQADALFRQKKFKEAILGYDKVLAINPRNEEAYYNKGQSLRLLGKMEAALAAYEMAIAINPNWWRVYMGKGRIYEKQKDNAEAIKWYQHALKVNPNIGSIYFKLGHMLHLSNQRQEAMDYYERCIALDPNISVAYLNKGVLLKGQGKVKEALVAYQKAAQLDKRNPSIFFNIGNAYLELRQYQLALKNYEITLHLNPNHAKAITKKELVLKKIR